MEMRVRQIIAMWDRFRVSVWLLPVVLLIPLGLATSLQISGSSMSYVDRAIYGTQTDPSLKTGMLRIVRTDEWLFHFH